MSWTLADIKESGVLVVRDNVVIAELRSFTTTYRDNTVSAGVTY